MARLDGKTVVVTGASSRIGEAAARRFSGEGANVVLVSRTENDLQQVAADLEPDRSLVQVADVGEEDAVNAMTKAAVDRFGQHHLLVNNAGTTVQGDITEISIEDYWLVMATLVNGPSLAVGRRCRTSSRPRGASSTQAPSPEPERIGACACTILPKEHPPSHAPA